MPKQPKQNKESHRLWKCEKGHSYDSPVPVTEVRCGECAKSTAAKAAAWMKPVVEVADA